jgi:hypothetical protein
MTGGENAPARRGMARRIASFSDRSTSPASSSALCCRFLPQLAEEGGRHQAGPLHLDPAQDHAGVFRLQDDADPTGLEVLVQPLSDLTKKPKWRSPPWSAPVEHQPAVQHP